jgi:hypothetical protein
MKARTSRSASPSPAAQPVSFLLHKRPTISLTLVNILLYRVTALNPRRLGVLVLVRYLLLVPEGVARVP